MMHNNQPQLSSSSLTNLPQNLLGNSDQLDLAALYKINRSMPSVPARVAPGVPNVQSQITPSSMQAPIQYGNPVFIDTSQHSFGFPGTDVSHFQVNNGSSSNPFNDNFEQDMSSKKMLTRVESMASYTEPGPVNLSESVVSQNSLEFESPITTSTEEFMRILERNSNILQIAAEKNKQLEKSKQSADNSAGDEADEAAADLDAPTAQEDDEDTDKIVDDDKKEETPAKKGIFRFWNSAEKAKTPGTPPNSPISESAPTPEQGQADHHEIELEEPSTAATTKRFRSLFSLNKSKSNDHIFLETLPPPELQNYDLDFESAAAVTIWRGGNEQKFMGEGQLFKGKLIGVLEVQEARGDRMCQDALAELKTAIKASGEHKQKVLIHIAVDGLKIRDEKTGDCLYHHPVHKISFIAQDMSDNRAFGYIYGSPENGHRFFGIKTEKAAGQVVVAMRDLFQVVFELKQKEIDDAIRKMDKDKRDMLPHHPGNAMTLQHHGSSVASFPDGPSSRGQASGALSDLLGLENELTSIQAGIRQIDKIAPSAPMSFQTDSMIPIGSLQPSSNFPTSSSNDHPHQSSVNHHQNHQPYPGLPHAPTATQVKDIGTASEAQSPINPALMTQAPILQRHDPFGATPFLPPPPSKTNRGRYHFPPGPEQSSSDDRYAAFESLSGAFGQQHHHHQVPQSHGGPTASIFSQPQANDSMFRQQPQASTMTSSMAMMSSMESNGSGNAELFTDLDPLGTGKSRPYVDKKDFFSELKTSSPKLGNVSTNNSMSRDSPVNPGISLDFANVGHQPASDLSLSTCPNQQSSNVPFVHNTSSSSRSGSMRSSSGCPIPPPRSGSELTYGHLDNLSMQKRGGSTSSDTMPRQIRNFGFSSHLSQPSSQMRGSNPASTITSLASSWRTGNQPSGLHDTRLYHTLGRPMTTFTKVYETYSTTTANAPLKVSLPPDTPQVSEDQEQQSGPWAANSEECNRYGSIPQLEASPRRYNRSKDQAEYIYDTSGQTLGVPIRAPADGASSEIPPKLPEKPSRRANQASPPPLPPKKPTKGLIGIMSYRRPSVEETPAPQPDVIPEGGGGQDIYDFPPMPMIGSFKMDKEEAQQCISDILQSSDQPINSHGSKLPAVSVEDLSKMSLIDLNAKLMAGQLPQELKGMSILELIQYINDQMKAVTAKETMTMKPSFSDNFVCDNNNPPPKAAPVIGNGPPSFPMLETGILKETCVSPGLSNNDVTSQPVSLTLNSSGFDDDFTPFSITMNAQMSDGRPDSQAASDHSVLSQSRQDEYDKYAVFRELQMEEELIRAWKTPSDEEKPDKEEEDEEEPKGDIADAEEEHYRNQPVCSSEGSPCSRSDTQSPLKSYSVDEHYHQESNSHDVKKDLRSESNYGEEEEYDEEDPDDYDEEHHHHHNTKRDSQVPIFHQGDEDEDSVCQSIKSSEKGRYGQHENEPEEEASLFSATFGSEAGMALEQASKTWTTFDDGEETLLKKALATTHKPATVAAPKENLFTDNFGDSTEWGTPPMEQQPVVSRKPPSRQLSSESQKSTLSHQGKCSRFSHRSIDGSHTCRGHSLEASEHEDPSNYTDWWPPSAEGAPPPKKKSSKVIGSTGAGNEAYSATPDHKAIKEDSCAWGSPRMPVKDSIFGDPLDAKFKIFSKVINPNGFDRSLTPNEAMSDNDSGIIPKSDSVNIFSIKDDPFDDDFFQ